MRRLIDRLLTPAFEAVVRRFDPAVEFDDHLDFLGRLPARPTLPDADLERMVSRRLSAAFSTLGLSPPNASSANSGTAPSIVTWDSASVPNDASPGLLCLDLASVASADETVRCDPAALATSASDVDWLGTPAPARRSAWTCLAALRDDTADRASIDAALRALIGGFEPRQWFIAKRGVVHGTSALLRALVAHSGASEGCGDLRNYVNEVLERLLKHVEVRRDEALRLCEGAPTDASQRLERIRFTIALLEGSRLEGDLRLLNAALKRNDLHLTELAASGQPRDDAWWIEVTAYASSLALQERLFAEAFPS